MMVRTEEQRMQAALKIKAFLKRWKSVPLDDDGLINYDLVLAKNPSIKTQRDLRDYVDRFYWCEVWDFCLEDRDEAEQESWPGRAGVPLQDITLNGETRIWERG